MGEPNIIFKKFTFESVGYFTIIDFVEALGLEASCLNSAQRVTIEIDLPAKNGNIYIVPQKETRNMVPNLELK